MARLPRCCPTGFPQHIIQRGNNRQICFVSPEDFIAYQKWLDEYANKFKVAIHAWVFMTNHVHLLVTPGDDQGVSLMMQALGRRYVGYFNRRYRRSGTLWEGRFKSCIVEQEAYLLAVYRYIELNPVRAGMVGDPSNYVWSSYATNALGIELPMCTPHAVYLQIHSDVMKRLALYRELVEQALSTIELANIRTSTNKQMALGSDRFKHEIETLFNRRVTPRRAGRRYAANKL